MDYEDAYADGYADAIEKIDRMQRLLDVQREHNKELKAKVEQYEHLITALRNDWHIEAEWDGLRKVWLVNLTDEGVRLRDERDLEVEKLKDVAKRTYACIMHDRCESCPYEDEACDFEHDLAELGVEVG